MTWVRAQLAGIWGGAALAAGIALTATSGWLIVRASEQPVILTLLTAIVGVRAFGMARPLLRHAERLRSHDDALGDLARARTSLYEQLIPLTPARLGRRARSDFLAGVVDDLTEVVEAQIRVRVPIVAAGVACGLTTGLVALVLPAAGLILAGWLLLGVALARAGLGLERVAQAELTEARAKVSAATELATRHTDQVQAIGAAEDVLRMLDHAHAGLARALQQQSRGRAVVASGMIALTGLATIAVAVVATDAALSAPVTALLMMVPIALLDALGPFSDVVVAQARAEASNRHVEHLLAQRPAATSGPALPPAISVPHLRLQDLTATWHSTDLPGRPGAQTHLSERSAVGPIDLDVVPGSRVAITGSNGSGKSTLLAVLARTLDPHSGSYLIDGLDATSLDLDAARSLIAIVDDEPHVFATTLRSNLALAQPDAGDVAIVEALRIAGLGTWLDGLADGLDTRLGSGGRSISGGERARLALARAVLSGRPIVLLDEPVAHLDHPTAIAVMRDVWRATRGRSVVIVSHRIEGLDGVSGALDLDTVTSNQPGLDFQSARP